MTDDTSHKSTDQLLADRQRKLDRLRDEFQIDPYGQRTEGIVLLRDATATFSSDADAAHKADPTVDERPVVKVAGRIMQHRVMGNLIFLLLRDHSGDLQVAVSKKSVGQPAFSIAKQADYGDIVCAAGPLGLTKTGEITVWAGERDTTPPFELLTKSLALPPGKHHGLTDPETRYRKRYVDLYSNPAVMQTMQKRIRIIDEMRNYLSSRGFLEVETPMLQTLHGGAAARPFKTHHNALDLPLTLRIAPELYLKRLLVGGMTKVFEINRNFRNEGISPRHNPEFTMLEAYEAYGNWETMAELVEDMVCTVAEKIFGTLIIEHPVSGGARTAPITDDALSEQSPSGSDSLDTAAATSEDDIAKTPSRQDAKKTINLTRPWRRVSMVDLVEERTGWRFEQKALTQPQIDDLRTKHPGRDLKLAGTAAEQLVEVYEKLIESTLIDPCFVTHVPSVIIPLAKKNADDPFFADVYELAINGVEISPGYTELNDPKVQEENFRGQVGDAEEQQQIDEDFLEALRVGMPPAGGMGLGIDRLVMMLTGAESIRDVILFPLMRPAGGTAGG